MTIIPDICIEKADHWYKVEKENSFRLNNIPYKQYTQTAGV